jgi:outer membrane protein TolC
MTSATRLAALLAVFLPFLPGRARAQDTEAVPLTLDEALRHAAEHSPTFSTQQLQDDTSGAQADLTCANLWPTLVASMQVARNDAEVSIAGRTVVNLVDTSGRIRVDASVFNGGNIPRCHAARIAARASAASRQELERQDLFQVAQAYYAVLAAQHQLDIASNARDLRATELEATQARFEASLALHSDVSRAALNLAQAEQTMDALAQLLGDPVGTRYVLTAPPSPSNEPPPSRPAEVAARLQDDAAQLRHNAVWWDFLPSAGLAWQANIGPSTFSNPDGFNWVITLSLTWVAFDGGFRYANLDLTEIDEQLAALDRIDVDRQESFDEAHARRRLETAQQQLVLAQQAEGLAHQTHDDISALRERGLATGLEESQALSDWVSAQFQLTISELESQLAALEAAFSSGSLWPEGVASLPPP